MESESKEKKNQANWYAAHTTTNGCGEDKRGEGG